MSDTTSGTRLLSPRWTVGLLALSLIAFGFARGDDKSVLPAPATVSEETGPKYDLDQLRATALANNPSIAAAKASLASAIAGQQGVENIRVPTFLQPDLPFRRKQACLGVEAAEAGVRQAELHTVFGVQFAYVSYLFAIEQEQLVKEVLDEKKNANLTSFHKSVVKVTSKGSKVDTDLKERDALFLDGVLSYARSKLTEAETGKRRALSALREAVGVASDVPLPLKHQRLLDVKRAVDLRQLSDLALSNRPELLAASINVQVSELEVKAQGSRHSLSVKTFASGGDLHANPLPAGRYEQEYRPGPIGPEMPTFLSGKKCDRVARATALASRAVSVSDKARALILLEVEQAFHRYEEATAKIAHLSQAAEKLKVAVNGTEDKEDVKGIQGASKRLIDTKFEEGAKIALDDSLKFGQVYSQVRVQLNEARYQQLIALITLERATGAAFRADLCGAPEIKEE